MSQQQHEQLVGSFHETLDNILANEGELGKFLDFSALHENLTFANKVAAFAAVPDAGELHTRQEWWQLYGRRVAGKAHGTVLFSFDARRYVVGKTERYFSDDQVYAPDGETRTLTDWEQIAIHAPAVLEAIGALEEGEQIVHVPEDEYAAVRKIVDKGMPEAGAFEKNASAYMICKRLGRRPSLAEFGLEGVTGLDKAAFRRAMTSASRCLFEVAQSAVGSYNALVAEQGLVEAERERVESLEKGVDQPGEEKIEAREGLGKRTVEHYDNVGQLDADERHVAAKMADEPKGGPDEGGNLEAEQEPERVHGASGLDRGVRASATELPVGREARPLRGDDAGQQAAGAPRADGGLLQGRGAEGGAGEARADASGRARTRGAGLDGLHRQGEQRLSDAQAGADARSGDGRGAAAADLFRGVEQGGEGQTQPKEEKTGSEERGEALYLPGLSEPIYQTPGPLPVYRLLLDDGEESGTRTWVNLAKGDWAEGLERAWSWSIEHASTEGYPLKGSDVYAWYEGGELVTNSDMLYATPVEAFVSFAYNCKELAKENIHGIDFAEAVRKTDGFSTYWYARSIGAQLDYSPADNGWVVTPKASELAEGADEAERLVWEAAERESGLYNTATGKTYILDLGGSGRHGVLFHGVQVAETPVESLRLEDGSFEDAAVFALENYNAPGASAGMGFVAEDFLIEMVPGWSASSTVLTEITREIAESPQDWCLADGAAIAANIEKKEAVRAESRAKAAERVALSPDMPLDVVLHDPENGLYVKLQYLDDNSYADYDIAVYDINGHEITTSAAGLGWEDAEDEDSWEPEQTYTFAEVAEAVNFELKGNWPTLFSAADAEIVGEEEADRLLELFGDQDAEEMEYIREHSREEVMARRYERAVYAARVFGVEGWQPSRGLAEAAGLDGRIRTDLDGRMDGLDGRTDLDGFGRTVEGQGQTQPREEKGSEGQEQPGEEKGAGVQQLSLLGDDDVQLSEQETLIREALLHGTGYENGKNNVMAAYARSKSSGEFTKAVKELYGLGGGFPVGEHGYVMHSPSKGFSVRKSLISSEGKVTLSWSDVSARLSALIEEGVYLNSTEKAAYEAWKSRQSQEKAVVPEPREEKTEQVKGDFEVLPGTEVAVEKVDPSASLPGMRNTYPTSFFGGEVDVVYSAEFGKEPLGGFERTGRLFIVRDAARAASGEAAWKWRDASVTTVAGSDAIFMVENFDPALVNPEHSYSTFYETPQAAYADFCRYGELSDPKNNLAGIDFKSVAAELEKASDEKVAEEQPGGEKAEQGRDASQLQPRVVELEGLDSTEEKRVGAYGKREQQAYANFFNGLGINVTHVDDEGLHEYKAEDNPLSPLYKGDDVRSYDTQLLPQGWKWVVDKSDQAKLVSIDGEAAFTATSVDMSKKLAEHDRSEATRALDAAFVTATKRDIRSSLVKLGYSVDNLEKLARELKADTLDDFYAIDTSAKSFEDALSFKDGFLLDLCMETIENNRLEGEEKDGKTPPQEEKIEKVKVEVKSSDAVVAPASEVAVAGVGAASRGPKQRYRDNVAAIRVLGELEKSGKAPTAKQAAVLSKYVGWGGLSKAFDANDANWAAEYAELKGLLSEEEYAAARESTLTSFYTPPAVVQATWDALSQMGFEGGRVLEPAMGTGRFIEWMPEDVREASEIHGVEKDSLSGRLSAALHGDVDVQVKGYEEVKLDNGSFDLAVSNVPFGDIRPYDPEYGRGNYIHDYYFDKTIDKVRPGGIVAFITSTGTMDKANNSVRQKIAQRAELLGAVRLPSDTFKGEAGTEASSDIIFLKKRATPMEYPVDSWVRTVEVDGMRLNAYYMEHPEMVLGEMTRESGPGGRVVQVCKPRDGHDLGAELKAAVAELPVGVFNMEGNVAGKNEAVQTADGRTLVAAPEGARKYSYVVKDGEVYYHGTDGTMELQNKLNAADKERVIAMCSIRDALRALNRAEADAAAPEEYLDGLRAELNRVYDSYVDNTKLSGGSVHKYLNKVFKKDSSAVLLDELEEVHEERDASGKKVTVVTPKAAKIFEKRTVYPPVNIEHADSLEDALAISLAETGAVDIARMAELVGMSETDVTEQGRGSVFFWDVESDAYVPSDEYLSGHIAAKIEVAKAHAAATGEDMGIEIEALEANKPPKVEAADIAVELGAPWVPVDMVRKFMYETFRTPFHYQVDRAYDPVDLVYSPNLNRWTVVNATRDVRSDVAETQYGTSERSSYQLFEDALNLKNTVVHKTVYDRFYDTKKVVDPEATAAAQAKQEVIREAFRTWIVATPERRAIIEEEYNKRFNAIKLREFDPRSVKLVGANAEIELEQHQLAAVARQLYGGNTLLYHSVGAGKTFEMAAACQEGKRIGLHNKAMIVVPNHLPSQFAKEYLTLYPDANILVTGDDDYSPKKLEATLAKIAMGEWDAVIVGFSKFEKIKVSPQTQMNYLNHRRAEIMAEIDEVKSSEMGKTARNRTVKELEKMRANAEAKIRALEGKLDKKARVEVLSFEELGIDRLFIDEAHYFKNLAVTTSMTRMRGISSQGSVKCEDLYMKLQWLNEKTGYRGVTFATGTAISNTLTEMYVMQQYLAPQELERMGLMSFDAWAGTFAKKETVIEIPPEATGYRAVERMSKFQNLPELMVSFKSFADVKTAEQLDLPLPELIREDIGIKPNQFQKDYVQHLAERAEHLRQCGGRDGKDNMLCVTNDGRKLGLDPRLIDPSQPQPAGGKVETAAELLLRNYADYNSFGRIATQMVFCDMSTPVVGREFSVYNALKETLAAGMTVNVLDRAEDGSKIAVLDENGEPLVDEKGNTVWSRHPEFVSIPADEIRYIHEAGDKEAEKQAMFDEFNEGRIKVLMGSTARMGAGTNAQRHLKALIHMDCQWRPSDMEQREGRIHRRGNEWKDDALDPGVIVSRLVTQGTFDSYMYQTVEAKAKFITQIFTDRAPARAAEDIDERALNYAEVKALAAGNPEIKEKMELDAQVARLERDQRLHNREQFSLENDVKHNWPHRVARLENDAANMRADAKAALPKPEKDMAIITIDGVSYTNAVEAGDAIAEAAKRAYTNKAVEIGIYRGFELSAFVAWGMDRTLRLKGEGIYEVALGKSIGNITRLDNIIDSLEKRAETAEKEAADLRAQIDELSASVGKPFPKQSELDAARKRLAEIDAKLNLGENTHTAVSADEKDDAELNTESQGYTFDKDQVRAINRARGEEGKTYGGGSRPPKCLGLSAEQIAAFGRPEVPAYWMERMADTIYNASDKDKMAEALSKYVTAEHIKKYNAYEDLVAFAFAIEHDVNLQQLDSFDYKRVYTRAAAQFVGVTDSEMVAWFASLNENVGSDNWKNQALRLSEHGKEIMELFEKANQNYREYDNALETLQRCEERGLSHEAAVGITRLRYSEMPVCGAMKLKTCCDIAENDVLAGHDWQAAVAACVWLDIDGGGQRYLFQAKSTAGELHEKALRLAESGQVAPDALLEMQTVLPAEWLAHVPGDVYQALQTRALDLMEAGKLVNAEQLPTSMVVRTWNETVNLDKLFDCLERGGDASLLRSVFSEDYYVYQPEQAQVLLDALALGIDPTGWSDPQGFDAEDMRDMLCEAKKGIGRTDGGNPDGRMDGLDGFGRTDSDGRTDGWMGEKPGEGQGQTPPGEEKGSGGRKPGELKSAGKPPKQPSGEGCGCTPDSDARAACGSAAARTGSFVSVETAKDKGVK